MTAPLLANLLPSEVAAEEAWGDDAPVALPPEEYAAIGFCAPRRAREYATARACAHRALATLGMTQQPILRGDHREPLWPPGIVGSITHSGNYRAAAVARVRDVMSLGIDSEPNGRLTPAVLQRIADPAEQLEVEAWLRDRPDVCWDRLLFCAKEAVYKVWYPLEGRWLGFTDARVHLEEHRFVITIRVRGQRCPSTLAGRWVVDQGMVVTAAVVPARPPG